MLTVTNLIGFGGATETVYITSYANAGGTGDRSAIITVTGTLTMNQGTLSNLVDGAFDLSSSGSGTFTNGQTSGTLIFTFATPKVIQELTFYSDNTTSQGTYQWSRDGVNVGSPFSLTSAAVMTAMAADNTPGTAFTLTMTSGNTNANFWAEELEFKIAAG